MIEKLKQLAEMRAKLEAAAAQKLPAEEAAKATAEYQSFLAACDAVRIISGSVDALEQELKVEALANFNGETKRPYNGVQIKDFTIAIITDPVKAREWALKNFTPSMKLDTKIFEKAAIDGNVPAELATVRIEHRVQLASDLSEYL